MDSEMNATWQDRVKIATLPPTPNLADYEKTAKDKFRDPDARLHIINPPLHQGGVKIGGPAKTKLSKVNGAILDPGRITAIPLCGIATIVGHNPETGLTAVGCVSEFTLANKSNLTIIDTLLDALGNSGTNWMYSLITLRKIPKPDKDIRSGTQLLRLTERYGDDTQEVLQKLVDYKTVPDTYLECRPEYTNANHVAFIRPPAAA